MNEGAAGATISPPYFEMCAIASAAVPTKKSIGPHRNDYLVAGDEAGRSSDAVNSGAIGQLMF